MHNTYLIFIETLIDFEKIQAIYCIKRISFAYSKKTIGNGRGQRHWFVAFQFSVVYMYFVKFNASINNSFPRDVPSTYLCLSFISINILYVIYLVCFTSFSIGITLAGFLSGKVPVYLFSHCRNIVLKRINSVGFLCNK